MRTLILDGVQYVRVGGDELEEILRLHQLPTNFRVYLANSDDVGLGSITIIIPCLKRKLILKTTGMLISSEKNIRKIVIAAGGGKSTRKLAKVLAHELRHASDLEHQSLLFRIRPILRIVLFAAGVGIALGLIAARITPLMVVASIGLGLYMAWPAYYLFCPAEWSARIYCWLHADRHVTAAEAILTQFKHAVSAR